MEDEDINEIKKKHLQIMNDNYYKENNNNNNDNNSINSGKEVELPKFFFAVSNALPVNYPNDVYRCIPICYNNNCLYLFIKNIYFNIYGDFTNAYELVYDVNLKECFYYNKVFNTSTWENPYIILCNFIENRVNPMLMPVNIQSEGERYVEVVFSNNSKLYIDKYSKMIVNSVVVHNKQQQQQQQQECDTKDEYKLSDFNNIIIEHHNVNVNDTEIEINEEQQQQHSSPHSYIDDNDNDDNTINKTNYIQLLKDKNIKSYAEFTTTNEQLKHDKRSKAIDSINIKEELFNEYIASLKHNEQQHRMNHKQHRKSLNNYKLFLKSLIESGELSYDTPYSLFERNHSTSPHFINVTNEQDREFIFNDVRLKLKQLLLNNKQTLISKYTSFLSSELPLHIITPSTSLSDVKKHLKHKPQYFLIASKTERNTLINDYLAKLKRIKAFQTATNTKETNITKLEHQLACAEFKALLNEKIIKETTYEDAIRRCSSELRWSNVDDERKRKEMFMEHIYNMHERNKRGYVELLESKIGLNQDITWHDVQHLLQYEPVYQSIQHKEREELFMQYRNSIYDKILTQFEECVNERSDVINKDTPIEGSEYNDVLRQLASDARYIRIEKYPDKRDKIIRNRIKTLKYKYNKQRSHIVNSVNSGNSSRQLDKTWIKGNVIQ